MQKNYTNRRILGILALLVVFSFNWSSLLAQHELSDSVVNELSDSVVNERLAFLKKSIEKDKLMNQYWWHGWLYAYSAATVGQGVVYFISEDKSLRQDMVLGAATTLLGAAGQFISPLIPGKEKEKLMLNPENTSEERMEKLQIAEELLYECAMREKNALSWQNHILPTSVNLVGGLITWLGFKRSIWAGVGNFALNTAITEAQIWTQPKLAKRRYKNYSRDHILLDKPHSKQTEVNWTFNAYPGGMVLRIIF